MPVRREDRFELVRARQIRWIRVEPSEAFGEVDPLAETSSHAASHALRVVFDDGQSIDGVVRYFLPEGRRRVTDYLEALGGILPLRTDDHLYLVRLAHVARIEPTSET